MHDIPIVQHGAERFRLGIEEGLLDVIEFGRGISEQLLPVGIALEQLCIPPHVAGRERLLLGLVHGWQYPAKQAEGGPGQLPAAAPDLTKLRYPSRSRRVIGPGTPSPMT